jgi:hypothetical protein
MPIILATWEAETGRIAVRGQQEKTVQETYLQKITRVKMVWSCGSSCRVPALQAQSPPEFKPHPTKTEQML